MRGLGFALAGIVLAGPAAAQITVGEACEDVSREGECQGDEAVFCTEENDGEGAGAASLPRGSLALLVLGAVVFARRRWERRQKTGAKKAGGSPPR